LFKAKECQWNAKQVDSQQRLFKKYYTLFLKMCQISIDGFKRDRYMIKIKDMAESVEFAQT